MRKLRGKRFQIVDEENNVVHMQVLKEGEYKRLLRLVELLSDEEALTTLDNVIKQLEAPKREVASKIAQTISRAKDFEKVLTEALVVLPKAQLEEITQRIDKLEFERKPDCLIIKSGEKAWTVPI